MATQDTGIHKHTLLMRKLTPFHFPDLLLEGWCILCGLQLANGRALTCPMSSRQLKMYFLASFDLILVSASCSSGDWKREHKTASATERRMPVHIHKAQRHAPLPTEQMISYECAQEDVKSMYSAHFNIRTHIFTPPPPRNIHNFLRCRVSMQGCCPGWASLELPYQVISHSLAQLFSRIYHS